MIKERFPRKIMITSVLNSLMALLLILNCQSVWQNSADYNFHIYELTLVMIVIVSAMVVILWGLGEKERKELLIIAIVYYAYLAIYIIFSVSESELLKFCSRFIAFPFCLMFFLSGAPIKVKLGLLRSFVNWAAIIAGITFILWGLSTAGIIESENFFNIIWSDEVKLTNYGYLYFSSPLQCIDWLGGAIRRNIGIFTEGPIFSLVLIFAFLGYFVLKRQFRMSKVAIISITLGIISTFSVTGYLLALVIYGVYLLKKYERKRMQILIGLVGIIGILAVGSFLLLKKSGTGSFSVRLDDFKVGIRAWIMNPIFGVGYEREDILQSLMAEWRTQNGMYNIGYSNSFFAVLAYGGIWLLTAYFMPVILGFTKAKKNYRIWLFGAIYLALQLTVIFYTFFINFWIWAFMYAFSKGKIEMKDKAQYAA